MWTSLVRRKKNGLQPMPCRLLAVTPEQSADFKDPAIFVVPHGDPRTLQSAVDDVFEGGSCVDFAFPGTAVCPSCVYVPSDFCFWDFLPWTNLNAPDRLFISSRRIDHYQQVGVPPSVSPTLTFGVDYSLVSVVYLVWGGAHYVTQFRLKGKWLKYDCTQGGGTSASPSFDSDWHSGQQVLYVYLKTDLLVVAANGAGVPSGNSQGDRSGLSPALLRSIENLERRRRLG